MRVRSFLWTTKPLLLLLVVMLLGVQGEDRHDVGAGEEDYDGTPSPTVPPTASPTPVPTLFPTTFDQGGEGGGAESVERGGVSIDVGDDDDKLSAGWIAAVAGLGAGLCCAAFVAAGKRRQQQQQQQQLSETGTFLS